MINIQAFLRAVSLPRNFSYVDEMIENEMIERSVVSKLSRGNISLQSGRFCTQQELADRVRKVTAHKFI